MAGRGRIEGAPFWSEAPFFVDRLGIPAVYCAPGDIRNCHTLEEHVELEEYFAGVVGFAGFIARFCGARRMTDRSDNSRNGRLQNADQKHDCRRPLPAG